MLKNLSIFFVIALLGGCGDEAPAPPAKQQAAAPAATARPSAPAKADAAAAMPATTEDDALVYDPIDVSKLERSWWQQYSSGS